MSAVLKRRVVVVLGSLALGTTAIYIAGAAMVFLEVSPSWTEFFLGHFLWMLYIPMCLLLVHLWARAQVGGWLLAEGRDQMALAWTKDRMSPNFWLRGRREALIHRLRGAQAEVRLGEYERAYALLWDNEMSLPGRAPELTELARWRVEVALRKENLVKAREAFDVWESKGSGRKTKSRADLFAARAEVAVRMGEFEEAQGLLDKAAEVDASSARLKLSQFLLAQARGEDVKLEPSVFEEAAHEVPGRRLELSVLSGDVSEEQEELPKGDSRSLWVLKQQKEKE